jgi:hypothetical protein
VAGACSRPAMAAACVPAAAADDDQLLIIHRKGLASRREEGGMAEATQQNQCAKGKCGLEPLEVPAVGR